MTTDNRPTAPDFDVLKVIRSGLDGAKKDLRKIADAVDDLDHRCNRDMKAIDALIAAREREARE
jgi:hypothetical protein